MTINVYTIVWNEEFMLPHFLKHYEKYADRIFVIDDHSTDKTKDIAESHPKVDYREYWSEGLVEEEFSSTLKLMAKNHFSDWAVTVDCDEFIHNLDQLKDEPPGVLKTQGYMMVGKTGDLEDCKKIRMKTFDKPVVFDPKIDFKFGDGRHSVNVPTVDSNLELWHYKYPSREYYIERNTQAYPRIMDEEQMAYRLKKGLDYYDRNV